jgi:hypothetical protein
MGRHRRRRDRADCARRCERALRRNGTAHAATPPQGSSFLAGCGKTGWGRSTWLDFAKTDRDRGWDGLTQPCRDHPASFRRVNICASRMNALTAGGEVSRERTASASRRSTGGTMGSAPIPGWRSALVADSSEEFVEKCGSAGLCNLSPGADRRGSARRTVEATAAQQGPLSRGPGNPAPVDPSRAYPATQRSGSVIAQ